MSTKRSGRRVFLSYNPQDQELARDIGRRLQAANLEPLLLTDMPAGEDYKKRLAEAFRSADAVLLLVTPSALDSLWTEYELGLAVGLNKVIVPVVASLGTRPLSPILLAYQAVPYDRLDSAIAGLARRLAGTQTGGAADASRPPEVSRADRKRPRKSREPIPGEP
ncbi:MAG TPA: toll/interleukin-1 receptor domain-containing protein [Gemmataceae bacterium]|nr:toll/interleukin-1 receptor domain-containing protein [Gemmataceae bacterium]